jgi:NAD(P)-dependent dehydrogenase (short-subunit alcohol dehydrogenase family)
MRKPFSLSGKVAIVTGASQGLGLEIARNFIQLGASVVLCSRDRGSLDQARKTLCGIALDGQFIEAITADVSKLDDVSKLVETTLSRLGRIDILVNNAGIYGPMDLIDAVDWAQWVKAIEINLFGSVLMCRAVLPAMKAQRKGKIIQLSGGGATNPLPRISAYAVSKAAIVRFAETLAEEVRGYGIDVNAIAPGALNTRLLDEVLAAGPGKVGDAFFDKALKQKESGGSSLDMGANLAAFLASDQSDGITGKLISAVWDDWAHWTEHVEELRTSDVYTLRRIVGRDRGFEWGDK